MKAWRIDEVSGESAPAASAPPAATDDVTGVSFTSKDSDDLPF